jgi:hypothetical protein
MIRNSSRIISLGMHDEDLKILMIPMLSLVTEIVEEFQLLHQH